ncbi:MAG TPA: hypothetical protein VMU94_21475 [Streptosporangiaceae bacterium]|nr:hypothetical protein [Streptosporangiaceae bacterium]
MSGGSGDVLAQMLHHAPGPACASWRLRGEILVHVEHLSARVVRHGGR